MSDAIPASTSQATQTTGGGGRSGGCGSFKALAMLIIGIGIGLVAGAFLAPFAENFFGYNKGIEPVAASGSPVKDERNTPAGKTAPKTAAEGVDATDTNKPANVKPPAKPEEPAAPGATPAPATAPTPKN